MEKTDLTEGNILVKLIRFSLPVLLALFLQAMYGAVDLLVVGKFGASADVSAVATGSQIMMTLTSLISSLAMGMTIFIGHRIGEGKADEAGRVIGSGILLFIAIGAVFTAAVPLLSDALSNVMNAPEEAFSLTSSYIRICGAGSIAIIAYNLIGSVFRGLGDSKTPLITVAIACGFNIAGDLITVAVFKMGTAGAALATVAAQLLSVVISFFIMRAKKLPVVFSKKMIRWNGKIIGRIVRLGLPIALQDLLVGVSFLIILAIVNSLGLKESAGVGVAEKVCTFIMLVPIAFMQSMSAFVAQNRGAGRTDRAVKALKYSVAVSLIFAAVMFYMAFIHGDMLASIFADGEDVILSAAEYLKAYAIDCLLVCLLFSFIGFYNGIGRTRFVMIQGLAGAFGVRVPASFLMSRISPPSLFLIGLATPMSTVVQIILCFIMLAVIKKSGELEIKKISQ